MRHNNLMKLVSAVVVFITPGAVLAAGAAPKSGVEVCAKTALAKYPGNILQAVLKDEKEGLVWELEIEQKDNKLIEVECNANSGKIVETETRVEDANDPSFKSLAKVSEDQARKTALEKFPGEVERVEYEIESDGKASYEFDIKTKKGDMRVEVDTASGKIVESSTEVLEIGRL